MRSTDQISRHSAAELQAFCHEVTATPFVSLYACSVCFVTAVVMDSVADLSTGADEAADRSSNVTSSLAFDDGCKSPDVYFSSLDVRFFGLSVIIPLGLVCNTMSLVVFVSRAMRRRVSSWYLAALAVSDNLSLIAVAFDYWLKDDRIGIKVITFYCVYRIARACRRTAGCAVDFRGDEPRRKHNAT
jgi:hypothetical protein